VPARAGAGPNAPVAKSIANGLVEKPWRVKRMTSTFGDAKQPSFVSALVRPRVSATVAEAAPWVAVPVSFEPVAVSRKTIGCGRPGAAKRSCLPLRRSATSA
jgi:hypothetical protein